MTLRRLPYKSLAALIRGSGSHGFRTSSLSEANKLNSSTLGTSDDTDHESHESSVTDNSSTSHCSHQNYSRLFSAGGEGETDNPNKWIGKILYNTYLEGKFNEPRSFRHKLKLRHLEPQREEQELVYASQNHIPVALQMLLRDKKTEFEPPADHSEFTDRTTEKDTATSGKLQFPYLVRTSMDLTQPQTERISSKEQPSFNFGDTDESMQQEQENQDVLRRKKKQLSQEEEENYEWFKGYGTPDATIPSSESPCGGCGAILHCQDTSIPGYMPSERFKLLTEEDLYTEICQRCYFLKDHNAALNVNVSKEDYPRILSQITDKFALVLLLIDILDFPCSIWPGIIDIIGTKRPVFLVGNKVDLLPQDSPDFLKQVKKCLLASARAMGLGEANIVHLELISATTGYGVEALISAIFDLWGSKGDIYIMGCTNVGKSSLFNAFLQSDLCKIRVVDIIQRATISQWPGTTLNLLKFPVTRPSTGRMGARYARLKEESISLAAHKDLRRARIRATRSLAQSTLIGHIGQTFIDKEKMKRLEYLNSMNDPFYDNINRKTKPVIMNKHKGMKELEEEFKAGKWCFDTPGAVAENQLLENLTLPELILTLPKQIIEPLTYILKVGWTLFVAGLARIDYAKGVDNIRLTVFSSSQLPVTIVLTEDADIVYKEGLGSAVFGVPLGDKQRLDEFPPLRAAEFEMEGNGHKESCADIVISSTGWIAVTAGIAEELLLRAFTPNGKGIFCRKPCLLPYSVNLKGKRIRGTPTYLPTRVFVP